jgi:hypothetical protein
MGNGNDVLKDFDKRRDSALSHNYNTIIRDAIDLGPLLRCDICTDYWPISNFKKDIFMVTNGTLYCDMCWGEFN